MVQCEGQARLLIESQGADTYMDSVYVFHSHDWTTAFQRALELGKRQEEQYLNADNRRVRWRLQQIVTLDWLSTTSLDGAEVYSEPVTVEPNNSIPFDALFEPEKSQPTRTGV